MSELYPSDSQLNALSGTIDTEQEVLYLTTGESPYYTSFYKMLYRLLAVARRAGDLRVYKDGDMTFGVRAGRFMDGPVARDFAGAASQALTNNETNYIYLTTSGQLTVSTQGFSDPLTAPHLPLATITTSAGSFSHTDLVDYRGRILYAPVGAIPRSYLTKETKTFVIPFSDIRRGTGAGLILLPQATADGTDLGLACDNYGQANSAPQLKTSSLAAGSSLTQKARFVLALPAEYVGSENLTCRIRATCNACQVSQTLALEAYRLDGSGSYTGSPTNLVSTSAQSLGSSWTDFDFTINGASLAPGDQLDFLATVAMNDTGGSGGSKQAKISSLAILAPVRG